MDAKRYFNFDYESGVLTVTPNADYIDNFFNLLHNNVFDIAKISNITAIVGENGTGKSNFLNFIKNYLVKAQGRDIINALVVLEQSDNKFTIIYDDESIPHLTINDNDNQFGTNYSIHRKGESNYNLPDSSVVFYSNIFDHQYEESLNNYYNISTNYLVRNDYKGFNVNNLNRYLDSHYFEDMRRQIIFIHNYQDEFGKPIDFPLPSKLSIKIKNFNDAEDIEDLNKYHDFYKPIKKYVQTKIESAQKQLQHNSARSILMTKRVIFKYRACLALIRNFLIELNLFLTTHYLFDLNNHKYESDILLNDNENITSQVTVFFSYILSKAEKADNKQDIEWINSLLRLTQYWSNFDFELEVEPTWTDFVFSIPINKELYQDSESYKFLSIYMKTYTLKPYLDLQWRDLSSGEKSFLNLLSRLYTLSDKQQFADNTKLSEQVLLLIDEGDLYYHPEWQRTFIKQLINFINLIYRPTRSIQIILTTHSPFFLSDLPSTSVNYLERTDESIKITSGYSSNTNTFAANIHTLLRNGFFMKSTFGEFAQLKINNIIDILNQKDETLLSCNGEQQINFDDIKKTINLIGEPVLKGKLLELFYAKNQKESDLEETRRQYFFLREKMKKLGLLEEIDD